ncbi:MAG: 4-oxalocrotonate tautomerase [Candidatus Hecatellales archaeon B24]|nr:MAG: 4-oxalocrotonate tautomerase [Candidatus Hecatellales archaeon B24]
MPVVEISLVGGELSPEQKTRIGSEICDILIREIPRLTKEAVWVVFNEKPSEDWIIGGKSLKEILQK